MTNNKEGEEKSGSPLTSIYGKASEKPEEAKEEYISQFQTAIMVTNSLLGWVLD